MEGSGLVLLVRVALFLPTLQIVVACLPLPRLGWFRTFLLAVAKRGKISHSNTKLTVPQRFFSHFYVVAVLWTTILLVTVWFYATRICLPSTTEQENFVSATTNSNHVYNVWLSVFLLLLMEAHVFRRFYETIYVFNYSPSARMHTVLYLSSFIYYVNTPLSLCCTVAPEVFEYVKKNLSVKGKEPILWRAESNIWMFVIPLLRLRWYAWIGAAIFFWGWLHQYRCHKILGSLRKKPEKLEEYVIPYGDWFEYVSSPHYTAEIVIYGGLLVASGGADLTLWLLFILVVANLGYSARTTHTWYLQKFEDYPSNRRALVPFVY